MRVGVAALVFIAAAACSPASSPTSQEAAPAKTEAAAPAAEQSPSVDPAAIQALQRMGGYLRTLGEFEVRARTAQDMVLTDTGQKVQFAGDGLYRIRRPNAFYLESNTDRRQRRYYYDGQNFTIFSPRMKVYAQRPAPATIGEVVDEMRERYGIPLPLADLFYWGTEPVDNVDLASRIGFARVNGQESDQYAFREGGIDWQVWIARGDRPLPLKVVITTRSDPAQPQFTSELTWNLHPRFSAATFAFHPPADAHAIQIDETNVAQAD